uniref:Probable 26S proteasome non-ATPase regulatory subunit 3 n=1 Tax=Evadne anonyx TaxID=141404 RepID=A0A9N6ZGE7_9CRUS|nr:EOG090X03QW [Evadne anonyx]
MAPTEAIMDVDMKDVNSPTTETETEVPKKDVDTVTTEDIREQLRQVEKSVMTKEPRFVFRVLRSLPNTRRRLNQVVLRRIIHHSYGAANKDKESLLNIVGGDESMEQASPLQRARSNKQGSLAPLPEVDAYIHMLVLLHCIDNNRIQEGIVCSDHLMQKIVAQNRRTLDLLAARCYFYHSRTYELASKLDTIRSFLHSRLRTCTLRKDFEGQAVLINCLLRNYLFYNLYDQADKLVSKSVFPESGSNNEWSRYLYYLGRIKAIQLEYSQAHTHLLQAIRKAPQHTAVGFKQTVQKLLVTVELLLGDIPERKLFRQSTMRYALAPYFQMTQAVRLGDIHRFNKVLETYGNMFQADHTYTLIIRLRHNVIKTAIRAISLSYSRISLADIATKLMLDSAEDVEFIVAKAIRDGVIEALLDHEGKFMQSKESIDLYSTKEPQVAFHQRIAFCLQIHNQSVKAMRFPPKAYNKDLESAEERREREQQDLEYAKEMAEEDDDGFP